MLDAPGLGTLLRLLTAKLDGDIQALYDGLGVPFRPRFFPIVQRLVRDGPAPVSALARATGVSQPAATQTIGELAKLGIVELSAGKDPRERIVSLTKAGDELADRLRPVWDAVGEAAQELDRELPHPLSTTLNAALEALACRPFRERIQRKMMNE